MTQSDWPSAVLAFGGAGGITGAAVALLTWWAKNRRISEKTTITRQGELLDRYEKHASEEKTISDQMSAEIVLLTEDRARWEEWGSAMEVWAKHQTDLCIKRGEEPIPVPVAPPRSHRVPVKEMDFRRRTSAQTGKNLKALADVIKKTNGGLHA